MHPEGTGVGHQGHWGRIELAYDHIDILLQFDYIFLNKRYLVCIWNFLAISSAERALGNFIWSIKQNTFMFSLLWTGKHQQIGMNTGLADGRWVLYQQKQLTTII